MMTIEELERENGELRVKLERVIGLVGRVGLAGDEMKRALNGEEYLVVADWEKWKREHVRGGGK